MQKLAGKIAIVTGASQGIGRAVAHRLYTGGASVVLAEHDVWFSEAGNGNGCHRGSRVTPRFRTPQGNFDNHHPSGWLAHASQRVAIKSISINES
jgi:hypothetical protein